MKANHYDSWTESYTADSNPNLLNNYYEPAGKTESCRRS